MTPRQAYVAKRVGILLLIGLAVAGYIHGIYWAGGVNQPGNNWRQNGMPWQAGMIDFAPLWVLGVGFTGFLLVVVLLDVIAALRAPLWGGYRKLPKAPTKAQKLAAKQAEREAAIARLERELGLVPDPGAERWRERIACCGHPDGARRLVQLGIGEWMACSRCGATQDEEGNWHE